MVNGKIFNDIEQWYDSYNGTEYHIATNFFISKHVGIVKKMLLDSNKTWNLIRYNIVQ